MCLATEDLVASGLSKGKVAMTSSDGSSREAACERDCGSREGDEGSGEVHDYGI